MIKFKDFVHRPKCGDSVVLAIQITVSLTLLIMLYMVVLTFESDDETLKWNQSNGAMDNGDLESGLP